MNSNLNLIVMLTKNDQTVPDAYEFFQKHKDSKAQFWGIKEKGLPSPKMKELCSYIKKHNKTPIMEVVAYTESECLDSARLAAECECEILMGTLFYDSVNEFCQKNNLKYMPFIGNVQNRPSVLTGSVSEMINDANRYLQKGVYGFDLLGYRYTGDADALIYEFSKQIKSPICIAGSINSYEKLNKVRNSGVWAFTIGSAFFEKKFGEDFGSQINRVCEYMKNTD